MDTFKAISYTASRAIDGIAGLALGGVAVLVTANILLRTLWNRPITGTYEVVGYLTAAAIGLSLAHCALQNSHIAVDFLIGRMAKGRQNLIEVITHLPVLVFLSLVTYHLAGYAARVASSGEVAPTTRLAFYPFIYLVALGFLVLSLTVLLRLLQLLHRREER
jgi:TRAP-type C4-dicarboxylate transport system permease small subunit